MDISVKDVHSFVGNGLLLHNTVTESMACKIPVIAPNNTSIIEIGDNGDRIFALEDQWPYVTHMDSLVRGQCDLVEVAEKLDLVHKKPALVTEKVQKAYDYVMSLTWDRVCNQWIHEFETLFF
jgi:glycosyltransferase involved in cell wall biosynthesis